METLQALGFETRRSVGGSHSPNLDGEMAAAIDEFVGRACAAGRGVRRRRTISFKFVIAPPASAGIIGPLCRINRAVCRAVELVAPICGPCDGAGCRRRPALRCSRFRKRRKKNAEYGKKRNAGNWIDVSDHRIHLRWEIESNTGLRLAAVVEQPLFNSHCLAAKTLFLRYSIVNAVF